MNTCCLLLLLLESAIRLASGAGWGEPCKSGVDGSIVQPHQECEVSKGILCQRYYEGEFCACQIHGILTYDQVARECRRRVGALCQNPVDAIGELKMLTFNHKCHENAECVPVNETTAMAYEVYQEQEHFICVCKDGFYPTHELDECLSSGVSRRMTSVLTVMLSVLCWSQATSCTG